MIPLYQNANRLPTVSERGNKALLFDKFYDWSNLGGSLSDQEKMVNLGRLAGACGEIKSIEQMALKQCELVDALNGKFSVYVNQWNFVAGMGIDHPLENGMLWHHTLGTPYLPGSSIKGMVRAFCEIWKGWESEKVEHCFGATADSERSGKGGNYIFFDAIPVSRPILSADVMTPHMGKWYETGGEALHDWSNTPGDWHSPVPVMFLDVQKIWLLAAIAPRVSAASENELNELLEAMNEAFEYIGAGAKTAAGYGHFVLDEVKTQTWKDKLMKDKKEKDDAKNLSSASPLEQRIHELKKDNPNPNETLDVIIYKGIQAGKFVEFRHEALKLLKEEMLKQKKWVEESKRPAKDKKYIRTREVIEMLKEYE